MLKDIAKYERYKISLPTWYHDDLSYWAWLKGTDRARLSSAILQCRIEDNRQMINSQLADIAAKHNISVDELKKLIRGGEIDNDSPEP